MCYTYMPIYLSLSSMSIFYIMDELDGGIPIMIFTLNFLKLRIAVVAEIAL